VEIAIKYFLYQNVTSLYTQRHFYCEKRGSTWGQVAYLSIKWL